MEASRHTFVLTYTVIVLEGKIRTEVILFLFLGGKTCKVAILIEVLLLGMNVVELIRKCVALCRLQQLPVTSSPQVHFKWGEKGIKTFKDN